MQIWAILNSLFRLPSQPSRFQLGYITLLSRMFLVMQHGCRQSLCGTARLRNLLTVSLYQIGELEKCVAAFEESIALQPSADAHSQSYGSAAFQAYS